MEPIKNNTNKKIENTNIENYVKEVFKSAGRMPTIEEALDLAFFVKHIVNIDPNNLQYASSRLKNNKEIVLNALEKDGTVLRFISDKLRDNKNIVLLAIKNNHSNNKTYPEAFQYASDRLKNDKVFIAHALEKDSAVIDYVSKDMQKILLTNPYSKKPLFPQMIKLVSLADKFRDMIYITPSTSMKSKKTTRNKYF